MPTVTYVTHDGVEYLRDVPIGSNVMRGAVQGGVPGIPAECGGACSCATCHVYIDPVWQAAVGAPSPLEADMLEFAADRRPESRLGCQIELTSKHDGLTVHVPAVQAAG